MSSLHDYIYALTLQHIIVYLQTAKYIRHVKKTKKNKKTERKTALKMRRRKQEKVG